MKKIVALVSSLVLMGAVASTTHAQDKAAPKNFFADCGIGGAIFKNDIGAVLSNIVWDFGLTATTSGLSSPETCEGEDVAAATFIHQTYANLVEETAVGEGRHISALLDIYKCDANTRTSITSDVRSAFAQSLSADSYVALSDLNKSEQYFNIVKNAVSTCKA